MLIIHMLLGNISAGMGLDVIAGASGDSSVYDCASVFSRLFSSEEFFSVLFDD